MRNSENPISTGGILEQIQVLDVADPTREMPGGVLHVTQHQFDATIVVIVGCTEEWIVVLLRLRPEFGVIDFEGRHAPGIAASEGLEARGPLVFGNFVWEPLW